jgi:hypothetical protein
MQKWIPYYQKSLPLVLAGLTMLFWSSGLKCQTTQQTVSFAGYTWNVRSTYGGPGPNYWSNSTESVWVDQKGYLHMKIRKIGQIWYCSEVSTTHLTQYGEHRFVIEGSLDSLDKSVVVGLFNYRDDSHEIDIEFSDWGVQNNAQFGSYTIQPYTISGNSVSFGFALDTALSTHSFNWQAGYITFTSFQGLTDSPAGRIKTWVYTGPSKPKDSDQLRTHINFWLFEGKAPVDTTHLELIVRDVKLPPPLGTAVEGESRVLPEEFRLGQNYPNPFNQNTIIAYEIPDSGPVRLDVFDTTGHQISTSHLGRKNAGLHQLNFDARDLASGIYYYRISSDRYQFTRKMVLMK